MNNIKITILMFAITFAGYAQVGIGTISPDASSALDITATDKGFLMPRMTTVQKTAIASPVMGLQVFDTDTKSVWTHDGTAWKEGVGGAGKFIDGITPDIAYYDGKVRIGTNTSGPHKLNVESRMSTDAHNRGISTNAVYEGADTSKSTYGVTSTVSNASTGTIAFAIGAKNTVANGSENVTGGTISHGFGSWGEIENSGNMGFVSGAVGSITNNGTISDAVGLYLQHLGTGTTTNGYAIFISNSFNKGTNDNFSIYSDSDADSYFAGNIGVGVEAPQQKVHISGALRLEPQAAAPAGGALGDLYVGTDAKLYFHNGTAWKEVQLVP